MNRSEGREKKKNQKPILALKGQSSVCAKGNQPASRELQNRIFIGSSPKKRAWGIGDLNNDMNLARAYLNI